MKYQSISSTIESIEVSLSDMYMITSSEDKDKRKSYALVQKHPEIDFDSFRCTCTND